MLKLNYIELVRGKHYMKKTLLSILQNYLQVFTKEEERQSIFKKYLDTHSDDECVDWNNFEGHIVAGGFIYAIKEKKFLALYHKDLHMYTYPGGHADKTDKNPLETSKREIEEETGLENLKQIKVTNKDLIPIDIDTHIISYNDRLNLPEHYHFDFRYLFVIDKIKDIKLDYSELSDYKWINIKELYSDPNLKKVANKIEQLLITEK